jgi:hypothetical protein
LLPKFSDRLLLDKKNPRKIPFTVAELKTIREKSESAIPLAESGIKRNFLKHVLHAASKVLEDSQGIGSIPAAERLYQFKITLVDSKPPIWRRIQVRDCTLDKFHERIQTAMGWTNSHLHQFRINDESYGDPELLDDGFEDEEDCIDSTEIKISEIVPRNGKRFRFWYEYDFGDGWEHELLFEGCLAAEKGQRYQGVVPREEPHLAGCLKDYFERSEQIPTSFFLFADEHGSAGLMLQKLPGNTGQDEDLWGRLNHLASTVEPGEMLTLDSQTLLHRLFHEETVRLFEAEPVAFRCSCSPERTLGALEAIGKDECYDILEEQGSIEMDCQFCHAHYRFDRNDIDHLFTGHTLH